MQNKVEFTIPELKELSKNRRYLCKSRKMKAPDHVAAQKLVFYKMREALIGQPLPVPKSKYYVHVHWQRDKMRGDVQNFINPIVDAIEKAIGINDCYAAVSGDWELLKRNNANLKITVSYQAEAPKLL